MESFMKKLLLSIVLLISANQTAAMKWSWDPSTTHHPDSNWTKEKVPTTLMVLEKDQPITDELLLSLNPEWKLINDYSQKQKNQIMDDALNYPGGDSEWYIQRSLIALAICAGADVQSTTEYQAPAIHNAVVHSDYPCTKYLLEKKADPNCKYYGISTLECAKNKELAALLIAHGARIPTDILYKCTYNDYPADLMQFYINKGIRLIPDEFNSTPLHSLVAKDISDNQILKIQILLKAGVDATLKNIHGDTALHIATEDKSRKIGKSFIIGKDKNRILCKNFTDCYIERHRGFLQFLAHIRQVCPTLHKTKDLLKQYFMESALHIKSLRIVLNLQDSAGKTPFDILPIEELNPATCRYQKYLELKKASAKDSSGSKVKEEPVGSKSLPSIEDVN
jgi:hypothetical protein